MWRAASQEPSGLPKSGRFSPAGHAVSAAQLDRAMAGIGFKRAGNQYEHPSAPFFVEFPAGPLGIGGDLQVRPVERTIKGTIVSTLSAADSCRDRLAAFYH